jgi:hypothetical protein
VFAKPRSAAPVFAVRRDLTRGSFWSPSTPDLAHPLSRALDDLGAVGVTDSTMFATAYYGLAFLDGGWARRRPYGMSGPDREWIVGLDALALLCHRMELVLSRTGRFRAVSPDEELEIRWELQRRDDIDLRMRSGLLAAAGYRPQLEELAARLRSPEPISQHCVDPLLQTRSLRP